MSGLINVSGQKKEVSGIYANVDGQKREIVSGWVSDGGQMKQIYGADDLDIAYKKNNSVIIGCGSHLYVIKPDKTYKQVYTHSLSQGGWMFAYGCSTETENFLYCNPGFFSGLNKWLKTFTYKAFNEITSSDVKNLLENRTVIKSSYEDSLVVYDNYRIYGKIYKDESFKIVNDPFSSGYTGYILNTYINAPYTIFAKYLDGAYILYGINKRNVVKELYRLENDSTLSSSDSVVYCSIGNRIMAYVVQQKRFYLFENYKDISFDENHIISDESYVHPSQAMQAACEYEGKFLFCMLSSTISRYMLFDVDGNYIKQGSMNISLSGSGNMSTVTYIPLKDVVYASFYLYNSMNYIYRIEPDIAVNVLSIATESTYNPTYPTSPPPTVYSHVISSGAYINDNVLSNL